MYLSPDQYEPDDWFGDASSISVTSPQKHNFHRSGDEDWIGFDAAAGEFLSARTDSGGFTNVDTLLALFDHNGGTLLAANDDAVPGQRDSFLAFQAPESGHYYLRVSNQTGIGSCFTYYSVWLNMVTPTPTPTVTPTAHRLYLPLYWIGWWVGASHQVYLPFANTGGLNLSRSREPALAALAVHPRTGAIALAKPYQLTLLDAQGASLHQITIGPRPVALTFGEGDDLFVSDAGLGQVWRIDTAAGRVQARSLALGRPGGLVQTSQGLLVADTAGDRLILLDRNLRQQAQFPTGPAPYALAMRGDHVAVAQAGGDSVGLFSTADLNERRDVELGGLGYPQGLVFDASGSRLYVLFVYTPRFHRIAEIDVATGRVIRLLGGDEERPLTDAYGLVLAGDLLLAPEQGLMHRYDVRTGQWLAPLPEGMITTPFGLALAPDRRLLLAPLLPQEGAIEVLPPEHLFDIGSP